jgi:hypothetical protein
MCPLLTCIESCRSTREEARDGNQYCLMFLLWWCVALLQDSWWCWEGGCIQGALCNGEFQFPTVIAAHFICLVVISFSMVYWLVHKLLVLSTMLLLCPAICLSDCLYYWGSIGSVESRRGCKCFCANVWSNQELACESALCSDALFVKYFLPFVMPGFWHLQTLLLSRLWSATCDTWSGSRCWQLQIWWILFQEIRSAELRTDIAQVLHGYKQVCRQEGLACFCFWLGMKPKMQEYLTSIISSFSWLLKWSTGLAAACRKLGTVSSSSWYPTAWRVGK